MQNLGEVPNLHGVEEDPTISEEINVRVRGYRSFRWVFQDIETFLKKSLKTDYHDDCLSCTWQQERPSAILFY